MNEDITIIGKDDEDEFRGDAPSVKKGRVPVDKLKTELAAMSASLGEVIKDIAGIGQYQLEEVTFKVEISCSGEIALLGTGVGVEAAGAVELKFCRPAPSLPKEDA